MGKKNKLVETVKVMKLQYFNHVIRGVNYNIFQIIREGNVFGKITRGGIRLSRIDNLKN